MDQVTALIDALKAQPGFDPSSFDPDRFVAGMTDDQVATVLAPILAEQEQARFGKFGNLFPDETITLAGFTYWARDLYEKHLEFFAAGADYRERCFLAANRVGKTIAGGYEASCHLTGQYPHWWQGFRFRKPIRAWAAGDTNETTRDIIQLELLGTVISGPDGRKAVDGSGIIPRDTIGRPKWKQGVQDLVDNVPVRHSSGGWSTIAFKSFDQGRRAFQGTAKELIWLDEECPEDVYNECLIRTATTRGRVITTFTPLAGLTPTVLQFMPAEMRPGEL